MQKELRRIQQEVNITFVYVTHDQEEAMSMSDRVAVMRNGNFEQIGSPQEIFQSPQTRFTADFMGACNIYSGRVSSVAAGAVGCAPTGTVQIETETGFTVMSRNNRELSSGAATSFSIRPDAVQVFPKNWEWQADNKFKGRIIEKVYLGDVVELEVSLNEKDFIVSRVGSRNDQNFSFKEDDPVSIGWNAEDCNLLSD